MNPLAELPNLDLREDIDRHELLIEFPWSSKYGRRGGQSTCTAIAETSLSLALRNTHASCSQEPSLGF